MLLKVGSLFFVILFGFVVYQGTRTVDLWNRVLMFGKILAFIAIIFLGVSYISPKYLLYDDPKFTFFSLPVLIISFGFHNMVPSLNAYFGGNVKRTRRTILLGSCFVLVVYLIWQLIVLGIVPVKGPNGLISNYKNDREASQALMGILGISWIGVFAQFLAFFAILTSFLAQALSVMHFLGDGLKIKAEKKENIWLCLLTLAPPCILSLIYPQLFFKALNFAGGFCAVVLFGVLPVLMTWVGRYRLKMLSSYTVRGGKLLLCLIFCFSLFVIFYQITVMLGLTLFPHP
jgi:tyrosine-specific transport protein